MNDRNVLITGAAGYLGRLLVEELERSRSGKIVALDVRATPAPQRKAGILYLERDIRAPGLGAILKENKIDVVVHLASLLAPPKNGGRELSYEIDVLGAKNVLEACLKAGVKKIIVSSSGAAYGYHADNPVPLTEDCPLRGNEEFPYSHHKKNVEEMLSGYRRDHPELKQVVFRVSTIIGENAQNQITALFEKPFLIGIRGSESPFVFIWDTDLVNALIEAILTDKTGVYNVAGDGVLTLPEIAALTGQFRLSIPAGLLSAALYVLQILGLTHYGPEQVRYLRYRPVLDNAKLKTEFGFKPSLGSRQAFIRYLQTRPRRSCRTAAKDT